MQALCCTIVTIRVVRILRLLRRLAGKSPDICFLGRNHKLLSQQTESILRLAPTVQPITTTCTTKEAWMNLSTLAKARKDHQWDSDSLSSQTLRTIWSIKAVWRPPTLLKKRSKLSIEPLTKKTQSWRHKRCQSTAAKIMESERIVT